MTGWILVLDPQVDCGGVSVVDDNDRAVGGGSQCGHGRWVRTGTGEGLRYVGCVTNQYPQTFHAHHLWCGPVRASRRGGLAGRRFDQIPQTPGHPVAGAPGAHPGGTDDRLAGGRAHGTDHRVERFGSVVQGPTRRGPSTGPRPACGRPSRATLISSGQSNPDRHRGTGQTPLPR